MGLPVHQNRAKPRRFSLHATATLLVTGGEWEPGKVLTSEVTRCMVRRSTALCLFCLRDSQQGHRPLNSGDQAARGHQSRGLCLQSTPRSSLRSRPPRQQARTQGRSLGVSGV